MDALFIDGWLITKTPDGQSIMINLDQCASARRGHDTHYPEALAGRVTEFADGLNYTAVIIPFEDVVALLRGRAIAKAGAALGAAGVPT